MKIYNKQISEGHRDVVGYMCNFCEVTVKTEDVPFDWITEHDRHYCPACTPICASCHKVYSEKYVEDWFKAGLCEACQEKNLT